MNVGWKPPRDGRCFSAYVSLNAYGWTEARFTESLEESGNYFKTPAAASAFANIIKEFLNALSDEERGV